jgi:protein-L-isoaspartate(D-aspartate) O-methyltransferase
VGEGDPNMVEMTETQFAEARQEMLEQIVLHTGFVSDRIGRSALSPRVMEVLGAVPRHEFVPTQLRPFAYIDQPLPIGFGKTISQPFIVALMTDLLDPRPGDRVLEIGTGLGYQAGVLSRLVQTVYSVEIIEPLAREAEKRLNSRGYGNVEIRIGDGSTGWREQAPFDRVIVTAAPELIPTSLLNQLKPEGRMVVPAGLEDAQQLILVIKDAAGSITTEEILPVRFTSLVVTH